MSRGRRSAQMPHWVRRATSSIGVHVWGVAGQVAVALPIFSMAAIVAHESGLRASGEFIVGAAVAAIIYMATFWALRSYVVLDGFVEFRPGAYVRFRFIGILLASILTALSSPALGVPLWLILSVILVKASDGLLDLALGFDQVSRPAGRAIVVYARTSLFRLLWVFLCLMFVLKGMISMPTALLASGVGAIAVTTYGLRSAWRHVHGRLGSTRSTNMGAASLLSRAAPLAVAALVCAGVTALPRAVAGTIYSDDALGVVGASLLVGGFFGMFYYTTWLRWFSKLRRSGLDARCLAGFGLETLAGVAILMVLAAFPFPLLTSLLFGFSSADEMALSRFTLMACALFFAVMNLANTMKLTPKPLGESLIYTAGLLAMIAYVLTFTSTATMPHLLLVGAAGMAIAGVMFFSREVRAVRAREPS